MHAGNQACTPSKPGTHKLSLEREQACARCARTSTLCAQLCAHTRTNAHMPSFKIFPPARTSRTQHKSGACIQKKYIKKISTWEVSKMYRQSSTDAQLHIARIIKQAGACYVPGMSASPHSFQPHVLAKPKKADDSACTHKDLTSSSSLQSEAEMCFSQKRLFGVTK
jgi:hypothetical protein